MTFPRPAHSVPFAAIPLQAAPDQKRATWHGVGPLSRRAFSSNQFGRFSFMHPSTRGMIAIRKDAMGSGQSYSESSRLFPSFLRAGAGSGDCSCGNLTRYSGRRLSFNSKVTQ